MGWPSPCARRRSGRRNRTDVQARGCRCLTRSYAAARGKGGIGAGSSAAEAIRLFRSVTAVAAAMTSRPRRANGERSVREMCGTDRPRPCATNRLRARESLISRTVAHRRAPSRHPRLRMAFKRSWVRLHSGHFYLLNRHDLPGILASRWLAECPLGRFLLFGARAIGGSRSELPGQLRLALLWRLGARLWETTRGMCRSRPGHQGGEMGTARTRLRSGAARYRVGA
jgi:hypothetical protein